MSTSSTEPRISPNRDPELFAFLGPGQPLISPDRDPALVALSAKLQDISRRGMAYFAANPAARWIPPVLAAELAELLGEVKAIIEAAANSGRIGTVARILGLSFLKVPAAALRKMTAPAVQS